MQENQKIKKTLEQEKDIFARLRLYRDEYRVQIKDLINKMIELKLKYKIKKKKKNVIYDFDNKKVLKKKKKKFDLF